MLPFRPAEPGVKLSDVRESRGGERGLQVDASLARALRVSAWSAPRRCVRIATARSRSLRASATAIGLLDLGLRFLETAAPGPSVARLDAGQRVAEAAVAAASLARASPLLGQG